MSHTSPPTSRIVLGVIELSSAFLNFSLAGAAADGSDGNKTLKLGCGSMNLCQIDEKKRKKNSKIYPNGCSGSRLQHLTHGFVNFSFYFLLFSQPNKGILLDFYFFRFLWSYQ